MSETLGAEFSPLYQLIPSLRGVVSTSTYSSSRESDDAEGVEGELALNRIIVLVRMFVAAVHMVCGHPRRHPAEPSPRSRGGLRVGSAVVRQVYDRSVYLLPAHHIS